MVAEFSSPSVPEITAEALMAQMRDAGTGNPKPYVLVDVRTADERVVSAIPGSISPRVSPTRQVRERRGVLHHRIQERHVEKLTRERGGRVHLRSVLADARGPLVEGGGEKTTRVHVW